MYSRPHLVAAVVLVLSYSPRCTVVVYENVIVHITHHSILSMDSSVMPFNHLPHKLLINLISTHRRIYADGQAQFV